MAARLQMDDSGSLGSEDFAEPFPSSFLGACWACSLDCSQAGIAHGLNQPLALELHNAFDTLIDGGPMDYIFDIRQGLGNYMALVKTGGNIRIQTAANNLSGHGLYQFSPEFFYRGFDPVNVFATQEVVLTESPLLRVENSRHSQNFHANDPADAGKHTQLADCWPTMIFIPTRKISDPPPFVRSPLQSDCSERKWDGKRWPPTADDSAPGLGDDVHFFYHGGNTSAAYAGSARIHAATNDS